MTGDNAAHAMKPEEEGKVRNGDRDMARAVGRQAVRRWSDRDGGNEVLHPRLAPHARG